MISNFKDLNSATYTVQSVPWMSGDPANLGGCFHSIIDRMSHVIQQILILPSHPVYKNSVPNEERSAYVARELFIT